MFRKKRQKEELDKKIGKIYGRIQRERIEQPRSSVMARMMPSNTESGKINVKIFIKITDESFLCRQVKLWYSAGVQEFRSTIMEQSGEKSFEVILANLPVDSTVLYYFELLDKGGVWLKRLRNEEEQQPFEFSTSIDGIHERKDWDDSDLLKCRVCEYMCQPDWDNCPVCGSALHDEMLKQDIFIDEQKAKELKRQSVKEAAIWKNTCGEYEALPECPNCGYSVRLEWQQCPICNEDLSKLKQKLKEDSEKIDENDQEPDYDVL